MEATQQTLQQIERAITKVAGKYSQLEEPVLTDIYIQVIQESGEILVYNDDDVELHRCVVEEWIENTQEDFYNQIVPVLSQCISKSRTVVDTMQIMRPFSFVLVDDEHEIVVFELCVESRNDGVIASCNGNYTEAMSLVISHGTEFCHRHS